MLYPLSYEGGGRRLLGRNLVERGCVRAVADALRLVRRAGSVQSLSLRLVFHECSCSCDGGVGFARFEGILTPELVDDRVVAYVQAQELSRGDEGLEVDHHL